MFTSCTIFIHTASCIFRPILYLQKAAPQNLEAVPNSKSSGTTGKLICAECQNTGTRQSASLPSAGRRQRRGTRHLLSLPSAAGPALGKGCAGAQHARHADGRYSLLSVASTRQRPNFAECLHWALGKARFTECLPPGTRQTVFIFFAFKFFYSQLKFEM